MTDLFDLPLGRFEEAGFDYMVSGSVAAMTYGEPRLTNDILRKLEYFLEGGSEKHLVDVRAILRQPEHRSLAESPEIQAWSERLGGAPIWKQLTS